jgi:hypothetical protein
MAHFVHRSLNQKKGRAKARLSVGEALSSFGRIWDHVFTALSMDGRKLSILKAKRVSQRSSVFSHMNIEVICSCTHPTLAASSDPPLSGAEGVETSKCKYIYLRVMLSMFSLVKRPPMSKSSCYVMHTSRIRLAFQLGISDSARRASCLGEGSKLVGGWKPGAGIIDLIKRDQKSHGPDLIPDLPSHHFVCKTKYPPPAYPLTSALFWEIATLDVEYIPTANYSATTIPVQSILVHLLRQPSNDATTAYRRPYKTFAIA